MNKKITVSLTSKQDKELTRIIARHLKKFGRKISMQDLIREAVDDYIVLQKRLDKTGQTSAKDRLTEM